MALACNPGLLIADEPTTALDVTIQAQILELLTKLADEHGTAIILITHDLGIIADVADDVVVMYAGRILEKASTRELFYDPRHPYTWGLLSAIPRLDQPRRRRLASIPGSPPALLEPIRTCAFRARCGYAFEKCGDEPPLTRRCDSEARLDRCWLGLSEISGLRGDGGGVAKRP
jgi:peptide/nickel transport system ATP-binding protein